MSYWPEKTSLVPERHFFLVHSYKNKNRGNTPLRDIFPWLQGATRTQKRGCCNYLSQFVSNEVGRFFHSSLGAVVTHMSPEDTLNNITTLQHSIFGRTRHRTKHFSSNMVTLWCIQLCAGYLFCNLFCLVCSFVLWAIFQLVDWLLCINADESLFFKVTLVYERNTSSYFCLV